MDLPIGGGRDYPKDDNERATFVGTIGADGAGLLERYGTKALAIRSFASMSQDKPLSSLPSYTTGEITYICNHENVRRLSDLLLRRTAITMEGKLSPEVIQETADIAANALGWDKKRVVAEIEYAHADLARRSVQNVRPETTA